MCAGFSAPRRDFQKTQTFFLNVESALQLKYFQFSARTFEGTVKFSTKGMEILEKTPKTPGQPRFYLQYESVSKSEYDIKLDTSGIFPVIETKTKTGKTVKNI